MATGYAHKDLIAFLDYLSDKGLMKRGTVEARKAASNTLLSVLSAEEREDLRALNTDELLHRFANLRGTEFKQESMRVYKSRLVAALRDFESYKKDPVRFRPQIATKIRTTRATLQSDKKSQNDVPVEKSETLISEQAAVPGKLNEFSVPIPIRKGVIVTITGIPEDLTHDEAAKIGKVAAALASLDTTNK